MINEALKAPADSEDFGRRWDLAFGKDKLDGKLSEEPLATVKTDRDVAGLKQFLVVKTSDKNNNAPSYWCAWWHLDECLEEIPQARPAFAKAGFTVYQLQENGDLHRVHGSEDCDV